MFDKESYRDVFDAVHAPDGTVQKILSITESANSYSKPKRLIITPLIVVLLLTLGVSAYAVWSIHSARQQELRTDLQIVENNVDGYVEYDVSAQEESGLVLLSSLNAGGTQYVYVNIAPVTEAEVNLYLDKLALCWGIDGTDIRGLAEPRTPAGTLMEGLDEIHAGILQYAYDEDSKALTLVCYLNTETVRQTMAELGLDTVPLSVYIVEDENVIQSFGPIPFSLTEEQRRVFDFDHAVYHDAEFDKDVELIGLELTPFSAVWKVRFEGNPTEIIRDDLDMPLPDWTVMEDKLCRGAEIIFSDGTSITTGGAIGVINEGNLLSLPCGWDTAININDVERIVYDNLILWEKE